MSRSGCEYTFSFWTLTETLFKSLSQQHEMHKHICCVLVQNISEHALPDSYIMVSWHVLQKNLHYLMHLLMNWINAN